jgi:hypothetical protein
MTLPRRHRSITLLPLVALVAWACNLTNASPSPSPSPSPTTAPTTAPSPTPVGSADLGAVYAEVNEQVRAIRGLDEKKPIEPKILSPEELATVIRTSFDQDYPPAQVAADEQLYHGLGLLPKDAKLADVFVDLLESQVAGLYDPISESLYVVSREGRVGAVERVFYSHEYDHALQDQHFDLEAIQEGLEDQADRSMARQALVEGDAYLLMTYWLQQHLTSAEIGEVITASSDPELAAALERIPQIVQSQILFAATQGTQFALALQLAGGWEAVDLAFTSPPESTEQIIHPEKYESREAPVDVDLPDDLASRMGSGWSLVQENTMGEHQTSIWLGAPTTAVAADGAAGWGGDRIAVLRGPDGAWAIAWHTVWDAADDAAEFEAAADAAVAKAGGPGSVLPGEGGTTRWVVIAHDEATLGRLANALGLAG